ncbi:hypothetical protein ACFXHA_34645 [Nocardia sp. NPDC059240]|uniref:hypothetical protein n=1 Tax=Nocardia sp. NPDC059240 TaxID=3346786 RepID=UPI00367DF4FE
MIILGLILLLCGVLFGTSILTTIGVILMIVGAAFWLLGAAGRPIGRRSHYY